MRLPEALEDLPVDPETTRVFGDPHQTPDGSTVIPVSKVRRRADGRVSARPLGVFVIRGGKSTWVPAVDTTRIALLGEFIGLVAATLATAAMVRRPPWPDVRAVVSRRI
ncbi:hypothetical protein AFM11_28220 [Mycolicibacterium wolinskyi]|uniref:Sporulation protein n=1 Tax=Mycolicibacterium wolinskyi TaxID=59750 RepID=A0A132PF40_9MYCO|nr:hypothetical protein [Mycolicibacterium wolinskyi]KWX20956.1 hypothetical protein AFM11_28220 [Mycolicibacterium wolinskyi]